jgi:rhodanese-related sulfurtransferase
MSKTVKEIIIILIISVVAGFTANAISPKGIPLFGNYSERFALDSSRSDTPDSKPAKQKTKEGFFKPTNITVEVAKKHFDEGVLFIDGREPSEYAQGHIKGAINISYKEFKDLTPEKKAEIMKDIPKTKTIVSYCGGGDCEISIDNAYEFAKIGYEDVYIYLGGLLEWQSKNYPINK